MEMALLPLSSRTWIKALAVAVALVPLWTTAWTVVAHYESGLGIDLGQLGWTSVGAFIAGALIWFAADFLTGGSNG